MITLPREELQRMLDLAAGRGAEDGARRALAAVGLHDEDAAADIRDLRNLLDTWHDAKRTILQTVVRSVTTALLAAMAVGGTIMWFSDRR